MSYGSLCDCHSGVCSMLFPIIDCAEDKLLLVCVSNSGKCINVLVTTCGMLLQFYGKRGHCFCCVRLWKLGRESARFCAKKCMLKVPCVLLVSWNGWKYSSSSVGSGILKRPCVLLPWHGNPLCANSDSELFCQMWLWHSVQSTLQTLTETSGRNRESCGLP